MDARGIEIEGIEGFEASLVPDPVHGDGSIGLAGNTTPEMVDPHAVTAGMHHAPPPPNPGGTPTVPGAGTTSGKPMDKWVGMRMGHFRIMRMMGQGTAGVVFQVEDINLKRIAALKVLRKKLRGTNQEPQIDRFLLEARAAAAIDHTNIAQVYEINQHQGWWYIALEFLEGGSLQDVLSKAGPLPPGRAALMVADAARGLAAAHEAGIIHRDVKPANLMLTRRGRCKVVDFGLVKLDSADNPFQDDHSVLGTPFYIAPEIVLRKGATPATDVYSLGASLYTLLTGEPMFRAETLKEIMRRHIEAPPPDPRALAPHVPAPIAELIHRAVAKDPAARPSAESFAAALQVQVVDPSAGDLPGFSGAASGLAGAGSCTPHSAGASASALSQSAIFTAKPPVPRKSGVRRAAIIALGVVGLTALVTALALWRAPRIEKPGAAAMIPAAVRVNSIGMRLASLPAGRFTMGSASSEPGRSGDERPTQVSITSPYEIGITEVTQQQWADVMGANYSPPEGIHPNEAEGLRFIGPSLPAYVSWFEAAEFCRILSLREGVLYRLPTEAEWEYGCRAGSALPFMNDQTELTASMANFDSGPTAGRAPRPMPVASFPANSWGLYDMHGNVMEWCADWYGEYPLGPISDPTGPTEGTLRVIRGGSWDTPSHFARAANRWASYPVLRTDYVGFRIVCDKENQPSLSTPSFLAAQDGAVGRLPPHAPTDTQPGEPIPVDPALPDYTPAEVLSQRLRSVGSDTMDRLMQLWERRFRDWHPDVVFRHEGRGSGTAVPALEEGFSHFGPMSRPLKESERQEFLSDRGYAPMQIIVAMDALAIYVHRDNPLVQRGLTLAELDAVFSSMRKSGHARPVETWGDLGLPEPWASRRINLFGRNSASGTHGVFTDAVLRGGSFKPGVVELVGSAELVDRVAADKFAIGYSGIGYHRPDVMAVPIAAATGKPYVSPSPESAHDNSYPLARALYLTIDHPPQAALTPLQREFIGFVLSKQGQELVAQAGYYPMDAAAALKELRRVGLVLTR